MQLRNGPRLCARRLSTWCSQYAQISSSRQKFDVHGAIGPAATQFIAKIASQADGDAQFEIEQGLTNQIAIAIQRGNATMILEALKHSQRASARPHRA